MTDQIKIHAAGQDIPVEVRPNRRARRLQFRLDARTGTVCLTLPPGIPRDDGLAFVRRKIDWILPRRAKILAGRTPLVAGAEVPVNGLLKSLRFADRPALGEDFIEVRRDQAGADLAGLLKTLARATLTPLAHDKAAVLGLPIRRLSFRDTKSRWGSCSSDGAISLNWRIICADPLVQDYLVAHEVAHLREAHHQPEFWHLCAQLMAQPHQQDMARAKLRAIGPRLLALPL